MPVSSYLPSSEPAPDRTAEHVDLCIIGAGIAGLNAAYVATKYLPRDARVVILDRHPGPGGMWNATYPYVRLHQPYRLFTAGDIAWELQRQRGYLADREEVVAHLEHCYQVIGEQLRLDGRWGWECVAHFEEGDRVVVTARDGQGVLITFTCDRLVEAIGYVTEVIEPLELSSSQVRSTAPGALAESGLLAAGSTEAVWVVGGGKTALDTIGALRRANPDRKVGVVTGSGMFFISRDQVFGGGPARWMTTRRPNSVFAAVADRFDGVNGKEVADWLRDTVGLMPLGATSRSMFGILSAQESAAIVAGAEPVVPGHLMDVVDDVGGPVMVLRDGGRVPLAPGAWVVNCTGHLPPQDVAHVPPVSPSGRVLSLNTSSLVLGLFSSLASYFLSHLFFEGTLADAPLLELDYDALRRDEPESVIAVQCALIMHNLSVIFDRVPSQVFRSSGIDYDRWVPGYRRLLGQLRFMGTHRRDRAHHRRALERFAAASGVRCQLVSAGAAGACRETASV